MDKHTITCDTEIEINREQINNIKPIVPPTPKKNKELPQRSRKKKGISGLRNQRFWVRSPVESPILLRREIPMAWGTTTDSLTPEINPFQYAIEIKCLTLKDQTLYLTLDG